ncbi:MAG: hypothetical protein L0H41_04115 [Microlunatus sp.]|nr:hypothetical protein [Microlunatus sp.]MDN5770002.1 hypothetical protein [Microlunatus sp.]
MTNTASRHQFDLDVRLLRRGLVLLGVGCAVWMVGAAVSATALGKAAKKWVDQMEQSPSEMAQRRMHQVKAAAAAGSKAWRDEH